MPATKTKRVRRVIECGGARYDVRSVPRRVLASYQHATAGYRLNKRSLDCPGYTVLYFRPHATAGLPPSVYCTCPDHTMRRAGTLNPCKHATGLARAGLLPLGDPNFGTYCLPEPIKVKAEEKPCA